MRIPGPPLTLADVVRPAETVTLIEGRTTSRWTEGILVRHGGGMNAGLVDGHARWFSKAQFWRVEPDDRGVYWLYFGATTTHFADRR